MSETTHETTQKKKQSLFREKTLEAMDSPEALNDYLRVTSPRVWLVLAAVIALLVGAILWGVLGRIDSRRQVAVVTSEKGTYCYVPFDSFDMLQQVLERNEVTVDGKSYAYALPEGGSAAYGFLHEFVDEQTISRVCIIGNLNTDDRVTAIPVDASFEEGVQAGMVTTETLRPISLLLQ